MLEPRTHFTRAEYDDRLRRTRAAMERAGLDLLVVSDPSNMHWLTGYDGWSFYVHQCVILPLAGEPFWYGRSMDVPGAELTAWLPQEALLSYDDSYVQTPERHPMDLLSAILTDRGLARGTIGLEMDNYYFSAAAHAALLKGLPDATLADATGLVNWQRAVKSPTELAYMKTAGRIVVAMHERIHDRIRPGLPKNHLVAEIYDAAIRGVDGQGGEYAALPPLLPSGPEASAPHLTWDDRPMEVGHGTFFEIAGCYRRYHCPMSRTVFLGRPTQAFLDAEKITRKASPRGSRTPAPA